MVQILIKMKNKNEEWGMIEFQGTLESKDDIGFSGLYIGDLHFDDKDIPYLIIGHHLLVGKTVELDKPFAVMRKNTENKRAEIDKNSMEIDNVKDTDENEVENIYDIVALVKRKIIFKNRPRPIITNKNLIKKL